MTLSVWRPGAADSVQTAVFVSFGRDLPVGSFEDMLSYLRFFTSPQRLERLRATPVAERGRAWLQFLAETDPEPVAEGHQGLQQYFARIQVANQRYREDAGPGWLTDRGMVFVGDTYRIRGEIVDTWHSLGMRGTDSNDVVANANGLIGRVVLMHVRADLMQANGRIDSARLTRVIVPLTRTCRSIKCQGNSQPNKWKSGSVIHPGFCS